MSGPRRIRIHRLVLDGVEAHQRRAVVAAFETELARLFADHPHDLPEGAPPGAVESPADIGRRAAAAVHARVVGEC
jgi:hypothetical protein